MLLLPVAGRAAPLHVEETPRFRFETPAAHARALAPLVAAAEDVRRHHCRLIKPCFEGR
ncbi:MAG: hypothetical protein FJ098_06190, partial [Deltaproteobacteria bacterium]|nr:hypothetical protein [Deltaproteobacteria bacterium]